MAWTSDTWINLFSAIGSFGAASVALWLGLRANRRDKLDEERKAGLCAASIASQLSHTLDVVSKCVAICVFRNLDVSEEVGRYQSSKQIREVLKLGFFRPGMDTLMGLTSLHNNCANRIASAFDILDVIQRQAERVPLGPLMLGAARKGYSELLLEEWASMFLSAEDLLRVALRECVKASELAAPRPTGEELHGYFDGDE